MLIDRGCEICCGACADRRSDDWKIVCLQLFHRCSRLLDQKRLTRIVLSHSSGNDGSWSTFNFSVGTPFRNLELLPSTQVPESWIVLDVACTDQDPANCSDSRGGTFDFLESSSWENKSFYALGAEANLGYNREDNRGFYAKELVQLTNPEGVITTVNHSVVAGIITPNFYLGVLGLAARPVVWEDHSDSSDSLITILKKQSLIPNLSYGYTAGASYSMKIVRRVIAYRLILL